MLFIPTRIIVRSVLFLVLGLFLTVSGLNASAQGISASTIGTFAKQPVPVVAQHLSWASTTVADYSPKDFSVNPTTAGIVIGVCLLAVILANVHIRPRRAL